MIIGTFFSILILLILLGIVMYTVGVYNSAIRLGKNSDRAFANIDVLLKQRHDELPKLVNACQAYMKHEKGILENVTQLRAGYGQVPRPDEKIKIENQLNREIGKLQIALENYPDLKADSQFQHVEGRMTQLEEQIADRRELFNAAITQFNIFIAQFPALIVAKFFSFDARTLLEIDPADRQDNRTPFPLDSEQPCEGLQ